MRRTLLSSSLVAVLACSNPPSGDAADEVGESESASETGTETSESSTSESSTESSETETETETETSETETSETDTGPAECGNGIVEQGEQCEDLNNSDVDDCTTQCQLATCGDGYVWVNHEECDDGNTDEDDGCANDCTTIFDPQCFEPYFVLDAAARYIGPSGAAQDPHSCDRLDAPNKSPDWQGPGWYAPDVPIGTGIWAPSAPRSLYHCGTVHGGYLADGLIFPPPEAGVVERQMCFFGENDDCEFMVPVNSVSCPQGLILLELPDVPSCDLGYCTEMIIPW